MIKRLVLFLKGIFMGISDLVPGVSGGTIALISGIYERLLRSINDFFVFLGGAFGFIFSGGKRRNFRKVDFKFLIIVILGILVAIFGVSHLIGFLVDNYYVYIMSFFVGLILASCFFIFDDISSHKILNYVVAVVGFLGGLSLMLLNSGQVALSGGNLFLGGFLASSAMFLPGISGSFVLLIMGIYEGVISLVQNVTDSWLQILIFALGVALGVFVISKVVSYLFKKDKSKTLYFLLGLVLGSLGVPISRIVGDFGNSSLGIALPLFVVGFLVVLGIRRIGKRKLYKKH